VIQTILLFTLRPGVTGEQPGGAGVTEVRFASRATSMLAGR
jgi:hypothetical protein